MELRSLIQTDSDVLLTIGSDSGEEKFVVSPGRFRKLAQSYGIEEVTEPIPVSEAMYDAIAEAAQITGAVREGARFLAASPKSRRELIEKLRERGYSRTRSEEAADFLIRKGYLNENKEALAIARSVLRRNRYGKNRIQQYLYGRGFNSEAIRGALNDISPVEWRQALMWVLDRKYTPFPDTLVQRQKAFAALARLGYSAEEVNKALRMRPE